MLGKCPKTELDPRHSYCLLYTGARECCILCFKYVGLLEPIKSHYTLHLNMKSLDRKDGWPAWGHGVNTIDIRLYFWIQPPGHITTMIILYPYSCHRIKHKQVGVKFSTLFLQPIVSFFCITNASMTQALSHMTVGISAKRVPSNLSNLTESAVGVFSAKRPFGSILRIVSQRKMKMIPSIS